MASSFDEILESIPFRNIKPKTDGQVGLYRVTTRKGCIEFVSLLPDTSFKLHVHDNTDSWLYILEGSGVITLNDMRCQYEIGDVYDIPRGTPHGFETEERTIFLSIQSSKVIDEKTG